MPDSRRLSGAALESIPIGSVVIGERRRRKLTGISALAKSIEANGLAHPIIVTDENVLVAGHRRLKACESLGWASIPARRFGSLSEEDLRALELDENTQRLDLDSYEASKQRLAEIRQAEAALREEQTNRAESARKVGHRPKGGRKEVARRTGVPESTIRDTERHVEVAERFPVLQRPDWKKYQALEAAEKLERLPERERPKAAALIEQPGIPPKDAIKILGNLAEKPAEERREIFQLAKSEDSRDRSRALTKAAELPPLPDPRLTPLREWRRLCDRMISDFPRDGHNPKIRQLASLIDEIIKDIKESA